VAPEATAELADLRQWVETGLDFAATFPPK